jgi:flagellar biosynthesis protein FlhB
MALVRAGRPGLSVMVSIVVAPLRAQARRGAPKRRPLRPAYLAQVTGPSGHHGTHSPSAPAMADQAQDRHLPATERKIKKAREDGQVARSRDLGHLASLAAGLLLLASAAPWLTEWSQRMLAKGLRFDVASLARPDAMTLHLQALATGALAIVLPLGAVIVVAAMAAGVLCGGWNFTLKPLAPTWQKISPVAGMGRVFSMQQLGTMAKACVLALVLGGIAVMYLREHWAQFATLLALPLPAALKAAAGLVMGGLLLLLLPLALSALIDVPMQRQLLLRQLRMSFEEVKKENKDVEGNAAIKSKMRARMREMANRRMIAAVPGADLVVMNPTHYAVALKYDEASMGAPRVVAKGADLMALKIRDVAKEAGVPVLQAPPLARALYAHSEIDKEIPTALFSAVAQVLAWVFQLRQGGAVRAALLATPPKPQVPPQLDPGEAMVQEDDA